MADEEELVGWAREVVNGVSVAAERRSAGASRAGYAVDVRRADGSTEDLWLRSDTGSGPQSGTTYTVRREAAVYRALQPTKVLAPPFVAVHPTREAFLTRRVVGRNWFSELTDEAVRVSLARTFMGQVAELHALDVGTLDLPELGEVLSVREHMSLELDIWAAQYRRHPEPTPVIELALAWLREQLPADPGHPPVLVQGDTGPGNFMFRDGELVAVTDWEMAHFGDPHEDLGWIYVRDLQERFTSMPDRIRDYEDFSGRAVDRDRLRYCIVFAQLRCAIGTLNGFFSPDSRGEVANHLIYSTLHLRLLGEALAGAVGYEHRPELAPMGRARANDRLFDVALDDLSGVVVPQLSDGFAVRRAKGVARILKFLQDERRYGDDVEAAERAELAALMASPVTDLTGSRRELCAAIAAGSLDTRDALAFCMRQADRATLVARRAMGALAQRTYSPIGESAT
jgi:aminoglycoside phosphotransferase (APT) family kinase protein